eukprot:225495-Amphidinium_carterae.1
MTYQPSVMGTARSVSLQFRHSEVVWIGHLGHCWFMGEFWRKDPLRLPIGFVVEQTLALCRPATEFLILLRATIKMPARL